MHDIANLTGSAFNDKLIGDNNANILTGCDGNDTLTGNGGSDTIIGGRGADAINAGAGVDTIIINIGDWSSQADNDHASSHLDTIQAWLAQNVTELDFLGYVHTGGSASSIDGSAFGVTGPIPGGARCSRAAP